MIKRLLVFFFLSTLPLLAQNHTEVTVEDTQTVTGAKIFTNIVGSGPGVIDLAAAVVGADLGAKMNNCAVSLPAAGGTCKGDNLTGALALSTAVTTSKAVVYTFCGQSVSQSAAVTLAGANSAVVGCPGSNTVFTKAGNIDQFTLSASQVVIKNLQIVGVKGSFTGNGIVTAAGALQTIVEDNIISAQANDLIFDNSASGSVNTFTKNFLFSWGVHAFESSVNNPQSLFTNNYALGDGTSTGAAILDNGSTNLSNNFVKDSNSVVLVDDSTGIGSFHSIIGNRLTQTNGWTGLHFGLNGQITGNSIVAGGANGPGATGKGVFTTNSVDTANADALDVVDGQSIVEDNNVSIDMSGVSNKCGINATGDQISVRVSTNKITINNLLGTETNYGVCDTPTAGHNLNIVFDGNVVEAVLVGGSSAFGFFLNNAANLNTNWSVTVQNHGCLHLGPGSCLKRVDTQNNKTVYKNIQPDDGTLDAGTGSTSDVFVFDNNVFTFATLPTPIGNGSHFYCSDCTQAKPTAAAGPGAFIYREAGANNGL